MKKPALHQSFWNAIKGLIWMIRSERNFQIEILGLVVNLLLIYFLKLNTADTFLILAVSLLVLSLEIINTAIEKVCDLIQPEYDERIKIIKDISAAAVFLAAAGSAVIGILIYANYLF